MTTSSRIVENAEGLFEAHFTALHPYYLSGGRVEMITRTTELSTYGLGFTTRAAAEAAIAKAEAKHAQNANRDYEAEWATARAMFAATADEDVAAAIHRHMHDGDDANLM